MSPLVLDFVPIWTLVLGIGVFLYVLLDGFDLGVGILYGFAPDRDSRNLVMNSIAPIWDGNETWLVLGGLALLAAFPLAFAIILPGGLFSDPHDAAGAHFPRRRFRVPLPRRGASDVLGSRLQLRLRPRRLRAGRRSRRVHSGLSDGRSPFLRRLVRLLHAVLAAHWRRAGLRLRPARRGLADLEDRRRASGLGAGARAPRACRRS